MIRMSLFGIAAWLLAGLSQAAVTRSVELWSEHPIPLWIESVAIHEDASLTVENRIAAIVADSFVYSFRVEAGRYVRFGYSGSSPETIAALDLSRFKRMRVPDVLPGGEALFLVPSPDSVVSPTAFLFGGPSGREVTFAGQGYQSVRGLLPGLYWVAPVYKGGLTGATQQLRIETESTTVLIQRPEQLGAVTLTLEWAFCSQVVEMKLSASSAPPFRTFPKTSCEATIAGLPPGSYTASYTLMDGFRGVTFRVEPQKVTTVSVR